MSKKPYVKKPYYAYNFRPGYINHFLDVPGATVLDSYVGLFKDQEFVLYMGDKSIAKKTIRQQCPKVQKILSMRDFTEGMDDYRKYRKVAIIDIDNNYQLETV